MTLADKLKNLKRRPKGPLWGGPSGEGWNSGVTQSAIKAFLSCRERFRIKYIEGWKPVSKFSARLEYGQLWHVCEEAFAANKDWEGPLVFYCRDLIKKYPFQQTEINHWFEVCRTQFPLYVKWWESHPEVLERTPLLQEYPFDVPYQLPSGRVVRLRGKFDGVDLIGRGKDAGIWLFETKTKGDIDEIEIERNLQWDLQTGDYMTSLVTLRELLRGLLRPESRPLMEMYHKVTEGMSQVAKDILIDERVPLKGVRYNVIRRPLSGGKGSIKQGRGKAGAKCSKCKGNGFYQEKHNPLYQSRCPKCDGACRIGAEPPETDEEFFARLGHVIEGAVGQEWEVGPDENYFFRRWTVDIAPHHVERFRRECLDPILEAMCNWYHSVTNQPITQFDQDCLVNFGIHWRHPFGAANTIDEYGASDTDEYVNHGSVVGLVRAEELFSELKT